MPPTRYTQSAVSQQIAALEQGDRRRDRVRSSGWTKARPYHSARKARTRSRPGSARPGAGHRRSDRAVQTVRVASTSARSRACPRDVPDRQAAFRDDHPAVDIRVFEEDTAVERLLAGELDVTFWVGPLDGPIGPSSCSTIPTSSSPGGNFPTTVPCEQLDGVQMVSFPRLLCDMRRHRGQLCSGGRRTIDRVPPPTTER